jgi:integrase
MNSRVREILLDMATRRLPQGTEHVFRGADGHEPPQKADRWFPRTVARARHVLTEAGRQADAEMLEGFTWHCLRHTFASRLAMAGVDLLTIKDLGGWRTLAMVTRYAHLTPGRLREGVERLVTTPSAGRTPAGTDTVSDTTARSLETAAV